MIQCLVLTYIIAQEFRHLVIKNETNPPGPGPGSQPKGTPNLVGYLYLTDGELSR